jgi:hypothetical protein
MPWSASPGVPGHLPTVGARAANGEFGLFASAGASLGTSTQLAWKVDDIDVTVHERRSRGVGFEQYDRPDSERHDRIAEIDGDYQARASASARHGFATAKDTRWGSPSRFALPRKMAATRATSGRPLSGDKQHRGAKRATLSQRTITSGLGVRAPETLARLRERHSRRRRLAGRWMGAA